MKIETNIYKCYVVECIIDNVDTYYKSKQIFGDRKEAEKLEAKMKADAKKWAVEHV